METLAISYGMMATLHDEPGWSMAASRSGTRTGALALDSLHSSHAIHQEADTPRDIHLMFDGIRCVRLVREVVQRNQVIDASIFSYSKGASVLNMLYNSELGRTTLQSALTNYLNKHAYGNAHSEQAS